MRRAIATVATVAALLVVLSPSRARAADAPSGPLSVGVTPPVAPTSGGTAQNDATQSPTTTPIKHFIFLMQENHSFDNYFGTYPGADGIPQGVCMPVDPTQPSGKCIPSSHVGNRAVIDLPHSRRTFESQYAGGRMDGFITGAGGLPNAELSMAYYDDRDLPWYWNVADNYVLFDRFFSSAGGGSTANHMYWVAGVPGAEGERDAVPQNGWGDAIPTVFDRLEQAGISWKFYIQNYDPSINIRAQRVGDKGAQVVWAPLLAMDRFLDQPDLSNKIVDMSQYYTDLENGTLPSVAFMVPSGTSEHPPGSIQAGESFVRTLVTSLMRSSAWDSSAFLWSYDDWGGFYDHVAPPQVDQFGYGFRVPALLVSPYAKKGYVDSTTMDFTSGLAFIRENWGIAPLASRDAAANSFMDAFDFSSAPRPAVLLPTTRTPPKVATANIGVLYPAYGMSLAVLAVVIGWALRRRRHRATESTSAPGGTTP